MRILRRRPRPEPTKEQALAEARVATARLRRTLRGARRHQSGKQEHPIEDMTPTQWLGTTIQ